MTDTDTIRSSQPSVGKRSACDRCRTQKLGCMRVNGHPTDACLRCVRSQVECVTSSSRRPGRPAKAAAARNMSSTGPSPQRNDYAPVLGLLDVDLDVDVADTFDFAAVEVPFEIPSSFWGSKGIANLYPDDGCFPDSGIGDDRSPSMPALELFPSDNAGPLRKYRMQLAHVQQTLYKQLFRVQSSHCDLAEVLRVTCVHHQHMTSCESSPTSRATSTYPSRTPANPLATVATIAAEFVDILSALVPSALGPHDHPTRSSHPNPHLSSPDLLIILSCYILLIHIYDYILGQLLAQVTSNPAALETALQSAPVLSLGGLAVPPPRHLPAHLVLVLLNNQLLPIEAFLGIPDSLRVSDVKEVGGTPTGGRFGQGQRDGLFSGAGGQALCMALVQVETEQAVGGTGGLGVIAALREKKVRVLEL
ncbi:hypothetical protein IFM58399_09780 [Aspergillus lentulus]|uniref:Zn(2)-C6 fungal-type domain-containing protein n=1 Tax=Aspergillus lentulus TaxID=293939 RepID=A0ABQ1AD86_ASPLE|nr:uncharacterized protein IFM58399_09780 [Aspergillus lentulus]KAF4191577.1 hypothetical protein CNMCM8694_001680 [Aspergillus lentulus]GFF54250.1 hypothetical protein IFM58399_09780 [Aspergillus lentulus]GFF79337.1 hypothetical protein IFM60648_05447 [Aspergillus lentulus]GFF96264.1 hypothetical protein IFM47457_10789 [Aspergillus lentulus]GFG15799.1 hypothetical protein IFM61392_09167 [Aspergillus lentulus]